MVYPNIPLPHVMAREGALTAVNTVFIMLDSPMLSYLEL